MSALTVTSPDPAGHEVPGNDVDFDVAQPMISCRDCGAPLELSQPDPQRTDTLLGTCSACGLWHRVQVQTLRIA